MGYFVAKISFVEEVTFKASDNKNRHRHDKGKEKDIDKA